MSLITALRNMLKAWKFKRAIRSMNDDKFRHGFTPCYGCGGLTRTIHDGRCEGCGDIKNVAT